MRRLWNPAVSQAYFIFLIILSQLFTASPQHFTQSPNVLRRILRAPMPGRPSIPNAIIFQKPRTLTPQLSPLELAIDSTFGFVASEEASDAACQRIPGLSNHQRNLCRSNPGLIWALVDGTQLGLYECVHQFKNEKWNCSVARIILGKPRGEPFIFNNDHSSAAKLIGGLQQLLQGGTRETAFVTAAWTAGAVQAVARACSRGRISTCDCDIARQGGSKAADSEGPFTWGGCSDPIRFGMRLVRLFQEPRLPASKGKIESRKHQRKQALWGSINGTNEDVDEGRILMDIHNQKVGRRFVWQSREKKCKCHGISGACSMRTCWQRVGPFRSVGNLLKKAYINSLQVALDMSTHQLLRKADPLFFGGMPLPSRSWQRIRRETQFDEKWISRQKDKLIYLDYSPDYCKADKKIGHFGVSGRQCEIESSSSPNRCSKICCSHGYDIFEVDTKEKCNCKFVWCCEVKCSICHRKARIYRCKSEVTILTRRINSLFNSSSISLWMSKRRKSKFGN